MNFVREQTYMKFIKKSMDENKIGWIFYRNLNDLGVGEHKLKVQYMDKKGNILDEKECQFKVLNEVA